MISIIICTYNRCDSLVKTLRSITNLKPLPDGHWEIIVVDNNSTDATRKAVLDFLNILPIRYVFEKNQGLSYARNQGVLAARGDILAFTDDDVIVDENWLVNIDRAFSENDVACVGGRILPIWEETPPDWLGKELYIYLALLDLGNERLNMQRASLWGANLSFRASVFKKYGLFDTGMGRIKNKLYNGEETRLVANLLDNSEKILYCPEILVHHCISPNRLKKSYFIKWSFDSGEMSGLQMGYYSKRNIIGIPFYVINMFFQEAALLLKDKLFGQKNGIVRQLKLVSLIGVVSGRLKFMRSTMYQM